VVNPSQKIARVLLIIVWCGTWFGTSLVCIPRPSHRWGDSGGCRNVEGGWEHIVWVYMCMERSDGARADPDSNTRTQTGKSGNESGLVW